MARRARPNPSPIPTVDQVANRLHSAAIHLLRRARRVDAESHLPAPQLSALSVIVYGGPITLGALAAAEQVRPPTMTRLVAAMESAGLVARQSDPSDGRVVRISPTAKGRRILEEGRDRRIAAIAAELRTLDRADLAAIDRALDAIETVAGTPSPRSRRE
jgi:DNA-binding MarR family transcriptional regulator